MLPAYNLVVREPENRYSSGFREHLVPLTVSLGVVVGSVDLDNEALPHRRLLPPGPVGRDAIFYTLPQQPGDRPAIQRRDDCLRCHFSDQSLGVAGMMVRSMFTAPDGRPRLIFGGTLAVDHRTPIEDPWGGYYVTGVTGTFNRSRENPFLASYVPGTVRRPS